MQNKRLPTIADKIIWNIVTKRQVRWDSVVEEVWKNVGGNEGGIIPIGE